MKIKKLFLIISFLGFKTISAQTGVGINTDIPNATLEIKAVNNDSDGIIFPTVNQFSTVEPSTNQNAMLVFLDHTLDEGAGFEGLYFWDAEENIWQYIFQTKMLDMNLFKTIVQSSGFPNISSSDTNTNVWFKTNFTSIEAPDGNYRLDNGDLIIGKTGNYSIFFTGGVYKGQGSTTATQTEVGIFLNNDSDPTFISSTPLPSADNGNRSTNHTISEITYLTKGQRISVKTRRTANITTVMGAASNYSLTLSYLD